MNLYGDISQAISKLTSFTQDQAVTKGFILNKAKKSVSIGNCFPSDLPKNKAIAIHVYDTSKQEQVYDGLIKTTQNIASAGTSMFADAANKVGGSDKFSSSLGKTAGGMFGSDSQGIISDAKNMLSSFGSSLPNIDLSPANGKLSKKYVETFYLPIPNNLQEGISNNYEEQDGWINDMPILSHINPAVKALTKPTATWSKKTGARNLQYWENKIQMYSSTGFREISLSWDLVPNNASESKLIHEMVKKIKIYGSPESAAGKLILKSPCFFGVEFFNKTLQKALQFNEVVLISAEIEYVPGGNMEMYKDEMPKHITLTINFRDREPKLREDWESGSNVMSSNSDVSCEQ